MNNTLYLLLGILVISAVTIALRALPFILIREKQKTSPYLKALGERLPYAVMAMLVVYCYKNVSFQSVNAFLPELICGGIVVLLHLWKRNTIFSIVVGTICYMLLVQLVFV